MSNSYAISVVNHQDLWNGLRAILLPRPLSEIPLSIMSLTSVNMIIPKIAKNAITIRKDIDVRSRELQTFFLLLFLEPPEDFIFFGASFGYIIDYF
jgi:hypothetical protein